MAEEAGKIEFLDGLRGLAALAVVVFHFLLYFFAAAVFGPGVGQRGEFLGWLPLTPFYMFTSGSYAVALFFVLSGFVLSYPFFKKQSYIVPVSGLFRRYFRLAIPMLITNLMYAGLLEIDPLNNAQTAKIQAYAGEFWTNKLIKAPSSWWGAISEALYGVFAGGTSAYNGVLWTMRVEFIGSILVYVFLLLFGTSKYRRYLYWLALPMVLFRPFYAAFLIGICFSDLYVSGALARFREKWGLQLLCLLPAIYFSAVPNYMKSLNKTTYAWISHITWLDDHTRAWPLLVTGASLVMFVVLVNLSLQKFLSSRFCVFLGKISFGLYLSHLAVLTWLTLWLATELLPIFGRNVGPFVAFAVSMPVFFGLAWALYHIADQPSIRFGKFLFARVSQHIPALRKKSAPL